MPCIAATITLAMNTISCTSPPKFFTVTQALPLSHTWQNFEEIDVGLKMPVSIFPLPEATLGAVVAIIVKVEGNSQEMRMTWVIKDEAAYDAAGCRLPCCGTDVSAGTVTSKVETQFEQLEFWTTTMENRSICQTFTFKICTGVACEAYTRTVLLKDFKARIAFTAPVTWNASLDMITGNTVTSVDETG